MTFDRLKEIIKLLNIRMVHGEFQILAATGELLERIDDGTQKPTDWAMELVDSPLGEDGLGLFRELASAGLINDFAKETAAKSKLVCAKCGADRYAEPCKYNAGPTECPMHGHPLMAGFS